MTLIYAEKADVAAKIAAALSGFRLPDGTMITMKNVVALKKEVQRYQNSVGHLEITYKGEAYTVTWGAGHMYCLADVPAYDPSYKSWRVRPTCFIPEEFKLQPTSHSLPFFQKILDKQRRIIKEMLRKADKVINATDDDREGELIFAYICDVNNFHKPFWRIHLDSQTESGIKDAFNALIPSAKVQTVIDAGRARSIYDWVIGTNMTTQMTLRYPGNDVLSIGRVQTPVLKMIVDREEAIASFVPKISWNIRGNFKAGSEEYQGLCKGSGDWSKKDADNILMEIKGHPGVITKLEKEQVKKEIPLLYSQTTLQIDGSKYFGYTGKETLDIAQALYENGYTTYPRSESQYLTDDMEATVIKTLESLATMPEYAPFLKGRPITPAAKFFDTKKVKSHYAIIPTGEIPSRLTAEQKNIYDLIVWSLIRTIYPKAILEKTSVVTTVDKKYDFTTSGSTIIDPGWMAVNVKSKETILPALSLGASYPGVYEGKETQTKPPERYDDGSIIAAMKTAGKDLDDAELKAILSDPSVNGIGTSATRAEIVETLVRRNYVTRQGKGKIKSFYATEKGINLIHSIPVPDLLSAEFTARMEQNLSKIEDGTLKYEDFISMIFKQTNEWCEMVKRSSSGAFATASTSSGGIFGAAPLDEDEPDLSVTKSSKKSSPSTMRKSSSKTSTKELMCPVCGNPLRKGPKAWNCTSETCEFHIFTTMLSHSLTDKEIEALINKGKTPTINNFVSKKTGKTFSASLILDPADNSIKFSF